MSSGGCSLPLPPIPAPASVLRLVVSDSATPWTVAHQALFVHGDSPGQNTGVGCHALLQGIFPTQGLNPGLPHGWWILSVGATREAPLPLAPTFLGGGVPGTVLGSMSSSSSSEWGLELQGHRRPGEREMEGSAREPSLPTVVSMAIM